MNELYKVEATICLTKASTTPCAISSSNAAEKCSFRRNSVHRYKRRKKGGEENNFFYLWRYRTGGNNLYSRKVSLKIECVISCRLRFKTTLNIFISIEIDVLGSRALFVNSRFVLVTSLGKLYMVYGKYKYKTTKIN